MSLLWPAFIPLSTAQDASPTPATYFITLSGSISPAGSLDVEFVNNHLDLFSALSFSGTVSTLYIPVVPTDAGCPIIPGPIDDCQTVPFVTSECYPVPQSFDLYYYNDPITYGQMLFEGRALVYLKGPLPPKSGSPASLVYTES